MTLKFLVSCTIFANALGFAPVVVAQTEAAKQEMQAANEAAAQAAQHSGVVHLGDQATLKLPPGIDFVPQPEASRLMRAYGNATDDSQLGFFAPATDSREKWIVVVYFQKDGYVKDEEARKWDPQALLRILRDNTEQQNAARRARGIPEAEIVGWMQAPQYDRANHRLKWAVEARPKDSSMQIVGSPVTYVIAALGREGFISVRLLTDKSKLKAQVPDLLKLMNNFAYDKGKRYQDFNAATDKVAAYDLSLLMGAGAPK
ncbi:MULTISPECIES: DUF2167 domain-containing protein [unclassified Achromobacter]|uniref:DUF2167 domain-containing protein n=1 Tax=unclassified Achromobacter TaxID=2626865 RepID=UPI000B516661|nr:MULTISPECIES: DUF2167 domain-containing protein [unclassified Achromobacter]OWT79933.1 hypothetical protein CEY05_00435 [Achromobacter sp. HZ34]OWT81817.1 hypothetical protein CEY04_00435 [Achromobacter sp. HZ28]